MGDKSADKQNIYQAMGINDIIADLQAKLKVADTRIEKLITKLKVETTAAYNRGYINGYKDAPKPNPDICQVCGTNKKGMEQSCR